MTGGKEEGWTIHTVGNEKVGTMRFDHEGWYLGNSGYVLYDEEMAGKVASKASKVRELEVAA
jgi:hypothetical protein